MTEVVSSLAAGMDACDLVDASDIVDAGVVGSESKDFEDFTHSTALVGETLEEAQAAAAEAAAAAVTLPPPGEPKKSRAISIGTDNDFAAAKMDDSTKITTEDKTSGQAETSDTAVDPTSSGADDSNDSTSNRYVTPKDFELLKVIGMGAFGKVLQVRNKQSKQILAMKIISKRQLRKSAGCIENVQAERNILQRVNHPFVVKMHCSFQTREKLFILMDFLAGGELFLRLGREGIFLEKDAAFYLAETISALDHLHTLGILHRDLKPENILLCNDGHICLTDFGLAKDFGTHWSDFDGSDDQERARTICGTKEYM